MAQHLQQVGHTIILGSRKASKPPEWLPQAEVAQTEWNDGISMEQICAGVDVVIHAAGMNAQDCAADPVAALKFNGLATARLVSAACRAGVKRFIYLSTAHVYASPLVGTITEETCPLNLHPYATSHLAGENAVLGASQGGQIEGIVLRLSNAFGFPTHKDVNCWMLLVNDLCRQAVQIGKMILHSTGSQQRDFIALTEICRIAGNLVARDFVFNAPVVFNLGSGRAQTVIDMAQFIQQRCKLVMGFEPELQRPVTGADERHEILEYRSDRLTKMGISVGLDNSIEIDSLLAFCHEYFNQRRGCCA